MKKGVSSAEVVRRLKQILGKFMQDIGIAGWGTTVKKEQGQYRVFLVDSEGRIIVSSIAAAVDVSDRWARELGKIDVQRVLGSNLSVTNPIFNAIVSGGAVIDPRNIRALTSADVVDVSDRWARELGKVDVQRFLGSDVSLTNPILQSLIYGGAIIDPRLPWVLNRGAVVNGDFEFEGSSGEPLGWRCVGDASLDTAQYLEGEKSVKLGPTPNRGEIWQRFEPPIPTNLILSSKLFAYREAGTPFCYVEYYLRYASGSTRTGYLALTTPDAWNGCTLVFDPDEYVQWIALKSRGTNTVDIWVDSLSIFTKQLVELTDNFYRELGTVRQEAKDRTISRIDDTIFTEGYAPNGDFETGDLRGWILDGANITVKTAAKYTGLYGLEIVSSGNYLWQFYYPAIPVDHLLERSMMVYGLTGTVRCTIYYTDGTSQASTTTSLFAWAQFQPSVTAGKHIAAIKLDVVAGFDAYYIDTVRIVWLPSITFPKMRDLMAYKTLSDDSIDFEENVGAGATSSDVVNISAVHGQVDWLTVNAEDSRVKIWWLRDGWDYYILYEDPSFDNLYDYAGGDDGFMKLTMFNRNVGRNTAILKRPIRFGNAIRLNFENPTGAPVICRAEGRLTTVE